MRLSTESDAHGLAQQYTRLKLFESVVAPSMMYGAGTWTTTKEHERQIRTTQTMLRVSFRQREDTKAKKKVVHSP